MGSRVHVWPCLGSLVNVIISISMVDVLRLVLVDVRFDSSGCRGIGLV